MRSRQWRQLWRFPGSTCGTKPHQVSVFQGCGGDEPLGGVGVLRHGHDHGLRSGVINGSP